MSTLSKIFFVSVLLLLTNSFTFGQMSKRDSTLTTQVSSFYIPSITIAAACIGYGIVGLENDELKRVNYEIREEVLEHHRDDKVSFDDFSQYAPAVAVYGLNLAGIKGRHNFVDRTVILGMASVITGAAVYGLKTATHLERPDGSSQNTFPSGHTATAFMNAEFLWQEYKDVSPWYGIGGYVVAIGTGYMRMYNNRHWLTDVAAGAGIGILSMRLAYWIHPILKKNLFKKDKQKSAFVMPFYDGKAYGVGMGMRF